MADEKYCGDCGVELELVEKHTAVNSGKPVGGQYSCLNCDSELVIVELGDTEMIRVPIPP